MIMPIHQVFTRLVPLLRILMLLLFANLVVTANASDTGVQVLDVAEHSHDGGGALAVVFNQPLDGKKRYADFLHIERKDGKAVDGGWILNKSRRILLFPHIEPRTQYKVTVLEGLPAANGTQTAQAFSKSIKTRNIAPSIAFAESGSLLPAKTNRGLPIVSVNVDKVDVNFHRVDANKFKAFFDLARYNGLKQFWNLSNLKDVAKLVYSARYDLNPPANKRRDFTLPTHKIKALREPGLYIAVITAAGSYDTDLVDTTYFSISDIGLHARLYGDRLDVYLSSLASGAPMTRATITLLDKEGSTLDEGKSTKQGLVSFFGMTSTKAKARYLLAKKGRYFTILDIKRPSLDLSDFNLGKRPYRPTELFLYGPRDIYRPGEDVIISGLLRDQDGKPTANPILKARFRQPDSEVTKEIQLQPQSGGYYEASYLLPKSAQTGNWRFQVDLPGGKSAEFPFKVEEFLPERMTLALHSGDGSIPRFSPDKSIKIPVLGEYLYGAPAADNRLETLVRIRRFREPLAEWKGFQFGDLKEPDPKDRYYLDDLTLDKAGKATIEIESQWKELNSPLDVYVTASLYETGGRPVTRKQSHLVWPKGPQIGIRPAFGDKNPPQ